MELTLLVSALPCLSMRSPDPALYTFLFLSMPLQVMTELKRKDVTLLLHLKVSSLSVLKLAYMRHISRPKLNVRSCERVSTCPSRTFGLVEWIGSKALMPTSYNHAFVKYTCEDLRRVTHIRVKHINVSPLCSYRPHFRPA